MRSVFIYSSRFEDFNYGDSHPFKPYRARLVYESCHRYGLLDAEKVTVLTPATATVADARGFHTAAYLNALATANDGSFDVTMLAHGLGSADNPVFEGVLDFSLLALGATLKGVDLIARGEADTVFNPVGGFHHAGANHAEGFCYVNDICVAINRLKAGGFRRILYVDIDAHHGNGVQDAYYADNQVLVVSFHQSGESLYPGTGFENEIGRGIGLGYTVNMPLPEYTDDDAYVRAFNAVYPELAAAFAPEIVIAQIGLDTLKKDPLTNMRCTNNGYAEVIRIIRQSCDKIVALGGGGYSINDVARGWTLAWAKLNRLEPYDPLAGMVGGAMYGYGNVGDSLYDEPYRLPPSLKAGVDSYVDAKVAYIRENVFPLHSVKT